MPAASSFDYAVVRVVPRVEREEFLNVGVIVFCRTRRYLDVRIEMSVGRLRALAPTIDAELVEQGLRLLEQICRGEGSAGPIGRLSQAERFHWLVAPRSTIIQTSAVHCGVCQHPSDMLDHLMARLVVVPERDGDTRAER